MLRVDVAACAGDGILKNLLIFADVYVPCESAAANDITGEHWMSGIRERASMMCWI